MNRESENRTGSLWVERDPTILGTPEAPLKTFFFCLPLTFTSRWEMNPLLWGFVLGSKHLLDLESIFILNDGDHISSAEGCLLKLYPEKSFDKEYTGQSLNPKKWCRRGKRCDRGTQKIFQGIFLLHLKAVCLLCLAVRGANSQTFLPVLSPSIHHTDI